MFKGLANLGQMVQQAQQMGAKMQAVQEQLKSQKATGAAGGGMVEIDVNGVGEALAVRIDPGLVERGEREMIEDLVAAAVNDAAVKQKELHAAALQEATGGMNLPGLEDMLGKFTGGAQ